MGYRLPLPDDLGMETTTKSVAYAYPSSPDAQRFRMPLGCYTVCTQIGIKPPVAIAAFATMPAAGDAARALPFEWSRYSLVSA